MLNKFTWVEIAARSSHGLALLMISLTFLVFGQPALAQPIKIMPLGSWTAGTNNYVSYRYDLWFRLIEEGYDIDFVGSSTLPISFHQDLYPKYLTDFDRDNEGLPRLLSSQMIEPARRASADYEPDIVLLWVGSSDISQLGSAGVDNADSAIRDLIEAIRSSVPGVTLLLGLTHRVPVLDQANVDALNNAVFAIASDLDTPQSRIIIVDHVTGFDAGSMIQSDGIYHNQIGEAWVAENWFNVLADILPTSESFSINSGINDAWYSPSTNGQGFLLTTFPESKTMFLAWFTFDSERPPEDAEAVLGEPGQRWLTAQGTYEGDSANLTIYSSAGGVFDSADPAVTTDPNGVGTLTVEFADCLEGMITYDLPTQGLSGEIPIQRILNDNVALCESLGESIGETFE
jgi:hypothetical protein